MAMSKFQQIKAYILNQIDSGEWQEQHPVPSENELAKLFSVSRMTSRRALDELSQEGILERSQGVATCVARLKTQSSLLEIKNIADEIKARNHSHLSRVITLTEVIADALLAEHFDIAVGDVLFHSRICHLENQRPLQLEDRYVNPQLAPDYLQQDFEAITSHAYLCKVAPLTQAEHVVEAVIPDSDIQHHLHIPFNQACLQIQRRTWSSDGMVSYAVLTHPGHRYRLGGNVNFPSINTSNEVKAQ
ncbi:Histidine utilization repressor [gamma proteobacterium IMCC1989]|nr:Histidine utilization repressor [gamma proteobacterium IMCC1989]